MKTRAVVAAWLIAANIVVVACGGRDAPPPVSVPPVTEAPPLPRVTAAEAGAGAAAGAAAAAAKPEEEEAGPTFPAGDDAVTFDPATTLAGKDAVYIAVDLRLVRVHPKLKDLDGAVAALAGQRAAGAGVNLLRDIDLVVVIGDSLTHTQNDVMTLTFAQATTSDAQVNRFTRALSSGYAKGGVPFDAGATPPVYATLAMMDTHERALLRPRSKLLVVAPPARAGELGSFYAKSGAPRLPATNTEALVVNLKDPSKLLSIPRVSIPSSVTAMRLSVLPHQQGDAEVLMDVTCTDAKACKAFADSFNASLDEARKSFTVKMFTRNALKDVKLTADPKSDHAKMQLTLSDEQLQSLVGLFGAFVGASP